MSASVQGPIFIVIHGVGWSDIVPQKKLWCEMQCFSDDTCTGFRHRPTSGDTWTEVTFTDSDTIAEARAIFEAMLELDCEP